MSLKLELNRQYVRRDGQVSGELEQNTRAFFHMFPFRCPTTGDSYTPEGRYDHMSEDECDLIRLATPEEIAAGHALPEVDPRDARIATMNADLSDVMIERNRLRRERDDLKARVEELEKVLNFPYHLTPTGGSFGTSVMEQIEEEVEDNARLYRLTGELRKERNELKAQLADLSQLYNEETQGRHKDYDDLSQTAKERDELKAHIKELERKVQSLEDLGYSDTYPELEQERDHLKAQIAELRQALAEETKACEALRAVDMQIVGERDELRTQLAKERAESYEILQKILDEKVVVEDRLAEANAKYEQLDSEGAGMLQELRRVRAELAALSSLREQILAFGKSELEAPKESPKPTVDDAVRALLKAYGKITIHTSIEEGKR